MLTAFSAILNSWGSNGKRSSGADIRRVTGAVIASVSFNEPSTSRFVTGQSQLSFNVNEDE